MACEKFEPGLPQAEVFEQLRQCYNREHPNQLPLLLPMIPTITTSPAKASNRVAGKTAIYAPELDDIIISSSSGTVMLHKKKRFRKITEALKTFISF